MARGTEEYEKRLPQASGRCAAHNARVEAAAARQKRWLTAPECEPQPVKLRTRRSRRRVPPLIAESARRYRRVVRPFGLLVRSTLGLCLCGFMRMRRFHAEGHSRVRERPLEQPWSGDLVLRLSSKGSKPAHERE
jgi:hypothetical protein